MTNDHNLIQVRPDRGSERRVAAIIPARGGSKRLYKKNIIEIGGKPLLAHAGMAALRTSKIDRVVLSTDDDEIARCGRRYGLEVPFVRPPELAADDVCFQAVILHAFDWLVKIDGDRPDIVITIFPNCPFVVQRHLDEGLAIFDDSDVDTVVSAYAVPQDFHGVYQYEVDRDGYVVDRSVLTEGPNGRTLLRVCANNGCFVACRSSVLEQSRSVYGHRIKAYVMPAILCGEIDTVQELALAQRLLAESS